MKLFGKCLRENFTSPLLFAAIILMFTLCGFGATVQIDDYTSYSFFELVFRGETDNFTAFSMAYKFAESSYYPIGLAVITAVPALYVYIRTFEKIHNFALIRTNYKAYSAGIILSSFLSGAIITLAGIVLYSAAAYLAFPSKAALSDLALGETVFARLLLLIKRVFNHAFVGGVTAAAAIVLYRFLRSDFFAATIPMMLMYISVKLLPNYREWLWSDINHSENVSARLLAISFPSNLIELGLSLERSFNAPFWLAYIVLCTFLFVMILLFYKSVKRV